MCVCVNGCHMSAGAHRCQKVLDPLELELQEVGSYPVWVMGTQSDLLQDGCKLPDQDAGNGTFLL